MELSLHSLCVFMVWFLIKDKDSCTLYFYVMMLLVAEILRCCVIGRLEKVWPSWRFCFGTCLEKLRKIVYNPC
jgi:hypothetical protein